jgi:hypothetical protein
MVLPFPASTMTLGPVGVPAHPVLDIADTNAAASLFFTLARPSNTSATD